MADVYYAYSYATAGWLILQSIPLLTSPTTLVTLLAPEVRETTPLEAYYSRFSGLALITIGLLQVLLTGSIPLTSSFSDTTTGLEDPTAPYALPTLVITASYHAAVAFFTYTAWNEHGNLPFGIAAITGAILSSTGIWCVLFASSNGRISRKTGADKRTSGYPFKNVEAHSEKKKAAGKRQ